MTVTPSHHRTHHIRTARHRSVVDAMVASLEPHALDRAAVHDRRGKALSNIVQS